MPIIHLIDDEEKLRSLLSRLISLEGFDVVQAGDCKTAIKKLEQQEFDAVLCDVKLPDGHGVDFVNVIKEKQPQTEVILLTAYGNIPDGVQAIKNGAFDYIVKGDDNNKIIPLLHRAIEKSELAKRLARFEQQLESQYSFAAIIGHAKPIREAIALAEKVLLQKVLNFTQGNKTEAARLLDIRLTTLYPKLVSFCIFNLKNHLF